MTASYDTFAEDFLLDDFDFYHAFLSFVNVEQLFSRRLISLYRIVIIVISLTL